MHVCVRMRVIVCVCVCYCVYMCDLQFGMLLDYFILIVFLYIGIFLTQQNRLFHIRTAYHYMIHQVSSHYAMVTTIAGNHLIIIWLHDYN